MSSAKYYNFPVPLLEGFMDYPKEALSKILYYAIYAKAEKECISFIDAAKNLNLNLGNFKQAQNDGQLYFDSFDTGTPMVGIEERVFWDYYDNYKEPFEKACLLAHLAIKSVLIGKPYYKLWNSFLWSRMAGKIKDVGLANVMELDEAITPFFNEYQTKKIKQQLIDKWHLVHYSRHTRGFYVSYELGQKELIKIAEKNRISTKRKQQAALQKNLLTEVLSELKNQDF
jgi:hypothetical protein